jgi:hypothetical protein
MKLADRIVSLILSFILPLKCIPTIDGLSFTFTLGAKQLQHSTLFQGLEDQILAGDPLIMLEFYGRLRCILYY